MIANLTRRTALGGMAALAVTGLQARPARASRGHLLFSVERGGEVIGEHRLAFTAQGADLFVDIAIQLEVTFASIPVFRYEHVNREHWRDGRLVALDSRTDDDGTPYTVTARAVAGGLSVEGSEGKLLLDAGTLTTAYWHPRTVQVERLLDTQRGRLLTLENRFLGRDLLEVGGEQLPAARYGVDGDLTMTLWYGPERQWCGLAFDARGEEVRYHPVDRLGEDTWAAIAALTV
jgi:hypothetical protein